jgi:predicted nucleotidyltransferase
MYHSDSDYDIAVISPDFQDIYFLQRQMLVRPLVREVLGDVPLEEVNSYSSDQSICISVSG